MEIPGQHRTFDNVLSPGSHVCVDTMILPRSSDRYIGLTLFCDVLTSYISVVPITAVDARNTCNSIRSYLSMHPSPYFFSMDRGTEYTNAAVKDLCQRFNICIISPVSSHSNSQASAESSIGYFKQLMSKAVQSTVPSLRRRWPMLTPHVTQVFNSSRLHGSNFCRVSLRYSPLTRQNTGFNTPLLEDKEDLAEIHRDQLKHIRDLRRHAMFNMYQYSKTAPLVPGAVCVKTLTRGKHKTVDGSRQLVDNTRDLVIITKGPQGMMYQTKSLIDQNESWSHRKDLERITIDTFYGFNLSEEQLFKNIATARINREYKKLSKGLYLSTKPVSHHDRARDDDLQVPEDEHDDQDPHLTPSSVHQDSNHVGQELGSQTYQDLDIHQLSHELKSILKQKVAPPPVSFSMNNRELKSLSNGIDLSRKLYKHYKIPISDDVVQLKNALRESSHLSTPALPRTLAVLKSNEIWDKIGLTKVATRRLSFAPDTEFNNITRVNLATVNANALLLSLRSCCSLREILCHSDLYN